MTAAEVVAYLEGYADAFDAPVEEDSAVDARSAGDGDGFDVVTTDGTLAGAPTS